MVFYKIYIKNNISREKPHWCLKETITRIIIKQRHGCVVVVVVCGFVCLQMGVLAWVCCVHARAQMVDRPFLP